MNRKDEKFIKRWEAIKQKGRLSYALTEGSVFGVIMYFITNLLKLRQSSFSEIFFNINTLIEVCFWIVGGFLGYLTVMWWTNEFIYKIKKRNSLESP